MFHRGSCLFWTGLLFGPGAVSAMVLPHQVANRPVWRGTSEEPGANAMRKAALWPEIRFDTPSPVSVESTSSISRQETRNGDRATGDGVALAGVIL